MTANVELVDVTKTYDRPGAPPLQALVPTNFTLQKNEFFSLVGPSGCGKSTILSMIAGLVSPTAGSLRIGGQTVEGPDARVGVVFQKATLLRWLSVYQNILLPATVAGKVMPETLSLADHLLGITGLSKFKDRYPQELSGGMQQRANVIRAIVGDPKVLLMDEPFSALDEFTRESLNDELLSLWEDQPKTVLFITHSISEAVYLSDRVGVMSASPGGIIRIVDIELDRPRSAKVRTTPEFYQYMEEIRALIHSSKN